MKDTLWEKDVHSKKSACIYIDTHTNQAESGSKEEKRKGIRTC